MSRTNIEIDDSVLEQVMKTYALRTKREAVDYALRRLLVVPMTREEVLAMQGTGFDIDNDELEGLLPEHLAQ
jgi:Arc/MetJ family transcription regulator